MNKTILSLLIFILLISLNLKAETFSMFGLEIGSKLDDSYKGGGKGGSWTGPIPSGCADNDTSTECNLDISMSGGICLSSETPPPITNKLIETYCVDYNANKIITAIRGDSITLPSENHCLKVKIAFEDAIRETNKIKRKKYSEFRQFYKSSDERIIEYTNKLNKEDIYNYVLKCRKNTKEQYELMVRLSKKLTFIDYLEDLLHDKSKIDTSGL